MESKPVVGKKRILLASVLKPIDDTRMFEKLGKSLSDAGIYDVFIVGFPAKKNPTNTTNIHFLPLQHFKRLSFRRLWAPLTVLKKILKVKPDVLIVNTHELLLVATINRILFGTMIVYDIQENYWRNILYTDAFPKPLRPAFAFWVRSKEVITSPLFHWNLLAEKGYEKEMSFFGGKATTLENKVSIPRGFFRNPSKTQFRLLFSGTLAEATGVFESIELAKKLKALEPTVQLLLIGYCAKGITLERIRKEIESFPFITLVGGDVLVPHAEIFQAISTCNFGLIYYPPSPHTENSIPTKLYEYLGCRLPILLHDYEPWSSVTAPFNASINLNFANPNVEAILDQIRTTTFYETAPSNVTWESEEQKLLEIIGRLLPTQTK
ncbi:MAG: glycosyltransferase [Cytophagales bacterium]|nr:glycosyltransferase [Cytophagales bacterium]MCA6366333.1 glycosyltransferase [Cytophagales bacterium]MCA6371132.1 glycosyltransferase [Cytophagales bacterium]MCA6374743.1 glycosyltransferase [Cytophagales bacterium]MCA6384612.1 glycosyltransferase [Cytophagales bacterium]